MTAAHTTAGSGASGTPEGSGRQQRGTTPIAARTGATRTKARKRALDILFEAELRGTDALSTLAERSIDADPPVRDYTKVLVEGVQAHRAEIDDRIASALASGWTLPRLPRVDRNVMRVAVFEIDHLQLAPAIATAEAVGLVAELSTDDSPNFVNGVLGTLAGRSERPA